MAALVLALALLGLEAALRAAGAAVTLARRAKLRSAAAGRKRVLCLGESTTFGALNSYPAELELMLNKDGPRWVVFNLGRPGIGTDAILQSLEQDLDLYRPDVVVAMMGINDVGISGLVMQNVRTRYRTRVGRLLTLGWRGVFSTRFPNEGGPWLARRAAAAAALRERARRALDRGSPRVAGAWLAAARLSLGRESAAGRLGRAACLLARGEKDRAAALLEPAEAWPNWDHAEFLQAARSQDGEDAAAASKAAPLFARAVTVDQERGRWLEALERGFSAAGDPEAAGRAAREKARGEALAAPLLVWSADACWRASGASSCWEGLDAELSRREAAVGEDPGPWRANLSLARLKAGILAMFRADWDGAERESRRALELDPASEDAAMKLAQVLQVRGRAAEARRVLRDSLALEPRNPARLGRLAAFERQEGRLAEAAALRARAERLAPPLPPGVAANYVRLADTLARRRIPLVCLAYPNQNADSLRALLRGRPGIVFADDLDGFDEELQRHGPRAVFTDLFAGSFGHCTPLGYRLLARNALPAVLEAGAGKTP